MLDPAAVQDYSKFFNRSVGVAAKFREEGSQVHMVRNHDGTAPVGHAFSESAGFQEIGPPMELHEEEEPKQGTPSWSSGSFQFPTPDPSPLPSVQLYPSNAALFDPQNPQEGSSDPAQIVLGALGRHMPECDMLSLTREPSHFIGPSPFPPVPDYFRCLLGLIYDKKGDHIFGNVQAIVQANRKGPRRINRSPVLTVFYDGKRVRNPLAAVEKAVVMCIELIADQAVNTLRSAEQRTSSQTATTTTPTDADCDNVRYSDALTGPARAYAPNACNAGLPPLLTPASEPKPKCEPDESFSTCRMRKPEQTSRTPGRET
ncbi:hypothetical protein NEOLEDRAFT_1152769 [Neolentinus lepideus HHB14362 ss-1]|uniref:Uncharacterized protein n=1 Tax=Neolentinus lepideus HHB14362 ss-1 TaxID=1314782 RepID=A0A165MBP4_9AGAM|nr:hypothetical protein NEOLEDRAFT_1152769 [Neolentinus lepideus HHB14362 ss-1]